MHNSTDIGIFTMTPMHLDPNKKTMTSKPLRVALIDDEPQSLQTLRIFLNDYCPQVKVIGEADSVLSGYKLLQNTKPDAIFLDVEMGDGTGFDLLKKFRNPAFQVIFTTAFDEFALKAFQVNAIDYLLKPIDIDDLLRAVKKIKPAPKTPVEDKRYENLLETSEKGKFEKIALSTSEGLHFIELKEVVRLQADANYTTFHLASGDKITVAKTLKNFDQLLPDEDYFRPHQSHIVNLAFVKKIIREDGGYLLMEGNFKVPISRSKKEKLLGLIRNSYFLQ